jgi:SNF2 family DNA or RNA helicase
MAKKVVLPKHLCDLEAIELVYGPPKKILHVHNFRPYQQWMAEKIKALPGVLLGAEMGLGKTAATLKAVRDLIKDKVIKGVLIIAPLRVAEETWPEEIAKWSFARHMTYKVVTGSEAERRASLLSGETDLTIINRENLLWLYTELTGSVWPFDMIVYDEISRLKRGMKNTNPAKRKDGSRGERRKTELGVIHAVRNRTKKFVGLSGTPAPNGIIDIWGPMYAVDGGERLGTSMTAFQKRWFSYDSYKRKYNPFEHTEAQVMAKLVDRFFSLKEEDYIELPPLVPVDHEVTLSPSVMKRYKAFEKEMAIEIHNRWDEPEFIEAVNNGVLTGKLLQFANGSLYENAKFDEDTEKWLPRNAVKVHDAKLTVLDSIIEEAAGKPVLVAYSFQFDKEAILKRYKQCREYGDTPNCKRDWDEGKIPIMLVHPASAGHGLNFQHGSNIAVWYGLTWSSELYQQFIKRLHRSGQEADKVFLHRIIAKGTADENILPVLRDRKATEDRIKLAVKARLDDVNDEYEHEYGEAA